MKTTIERLERRALLTALNLDTAFDNDGLVTSDWGGPSAESINAVAVDGSNRIVAVGSGGHVVARYLPSGQLDSTFGLKDVGYNAIADDVLVQPDGGIVVAGRWGGFPFIRRYSSSGTVTWSRDWSNTNLGDPIDTSLPVSLASDSQGNLFVAATAANYYSTWIELLRVNAAGASISTGAVHPFNEFSVSAADIAVTSDDKLLILGHTQAAGQDGLPTMPVVIRMADLNTPDTTFGDGSFGIDFNSDDGGIRLTSPYDPYTTAHANRLLVTPSNGYVVAGQLNDNAALWNVTDAGQLNASFGDGGRSVIEVDPYTGHAAFNDVALHNGQLLAVGDGNYGTTSILGAFSLTGAPDASFDGDGVRREDLANGYSNSLRSMAFDAAGNLVAGGFGDTATTEDWLLARYVYAGPPVTPPFSATVTLTVFDDLNGNGSQDAGEPGLPGQTVWLDPTPSDTSDALLSATTNASGLATWSVSRSGQMVLSMSPISGRKATSDLFGVVNVTASGGTYTTWPLGFRIIPPNAQLDTSYGASGLTRLPNRPSAARFTGDGKVYLALSNGKVERRIVNTGALDPTWGTNGVAQAAPSNSGRTIYDVLPLPDGKVLVASQNGDIYIDRLLANGTPDTSFGVSGTRRLDFGASEFTPNVALGPNGTIIVAAERQVPASGYASSTAIARLLPNGSLDPSFDGDGMQIYDPSGTPGWYYRLNTLAVQADGKILFAAQQDDSPFADVIVRINADGSLDTGFADGDGIYTLPGVGTGYTSVYRLAVDAANRILYAGDSQGSGSDLNSQMLVGRLTANGTLDASFGTGGITRARFTRDLATGTNTVSSYGRSLAVGADGSILLAGQAFTTSRNFNSDVGLMYLKPDGTLDTSFGVAGLARVAVSNVRDMSLAATIGADRKPLLLLTTDATSPAPAYLARFSVASPATISGVVFNDVNGNGSKDPSEGGIAGRTVFLDADNDNVLDLDELRTTTDAAGAYQFTGLLAGQWRVRQSSPDRWSQTAPAANAPLTLTLAAGQQASGANLGSRNTGGPGVTSSLFRTDTALALEMTWEESVATSLAADDVSVVNLLTGQPLPGTGWTLSVTGSTASVRLLPTTPDGNYQVRIRAGGVASSSGVSNPSAINLPPFFVLTGDLNRDRSVDFADLLILAKNYGQSGRTFSQGNVDYSADGSVDFNDLLTLAKAYGKTLNAPAASAPVVAETTSPTRRGERVANGVLA